MSKIYCKTYSYNVSTDNTSSSSLVRLVFIQLSPAGIGCELGYHWVAVTCYGLYIDLSMMMSRSFLVDSLILKKSGEQVRGFSPPRSPYNSSAPPGHTDAHRAASEHALHSLTRPHGSSLVDVCCPWCVHGTNPPNMLTGSLPTTGPLSLVKPIATTSTLSIPTTAFTTTHPIFSMTHRPPLGALPAPSAFTSTDPQSHPLRAMDPRRIRYMNLGKFYTSSYFRPLVTCTSQ